MDEAELVLAGHKFSERDISVPARLENNWGVGYSQVNNMNNEEELVGTFNNLTIFAQDGPNQQLPSLYTGADPGPCPSSSESRHEPIQVVQPDELVAQNQNHHNAGESEQPLALTQKTGGPGGKANRKGKKKAAVVFVEADLEGEELVEMEVTVSGRNLRSRRK